MTHKIPKNQFVLRKQLHPHTQNPAGSRQTPNHGGKRNQRRLLLSWWALEASPRQRTNGESAIAAE